MARISATQITLADEATPAVTLPNMVRGNAQAVRLTTHLDPNTIPANAASIRMTVDMFTTAGKPGLPGWFHSRVHFTGPHTEMVAVANLGDPPRCKVTVPHPPHPMGEVFDFGANSIFRSQVMRVSTYWEVLLNYLWHGGPGPYEAEISVTALDGAGAPIANSTDTFFYPFVSTII